jgi:integrase
MYATLHVVLAEAAEDGLLPANPVSGLSRKLKLSSKVKARQDATKKKAMTREERDAFLRAAERVASWWAPMWTVQTLTGLRPGEVYAIEERDLDLDHRRLRVERTLSDDGKRVDTPKGGFSRDVDLSNEAVRVLRAHLVRRREEKLRRQWAALPKALFCSTDGTHADPSGVRQAFRAACRTAGLVQEREAAPEKPAARFTPHGLRHTFAALHLQAPTSTTSPGCSGMPTSARPSTPTAPGSSPTVVRASTSSTASRARATYRRHGREAACTHHRRGLQAICKHCATLLPLARATA